MNLCFRPLTGVQKPSQPLLPNTLELPVECKVQSIKHFKCVLLISDFEIKKNLKSSNCIVSSRRHSPMFSPESDLIISLFSPLSHYYDYVKLDKNFLNSASVPARSVSESPRLTRLTEILERSARARTRITHRE